MLKKNLKLVPKLFLKLVCLVKVKTIRFIKAISGNIFFNFIHFNKVLGLDQSTLLLINLVLKSVVTY